MTLQPQVIMGILIMITSVVVIIILWRSKASVANVAAGTFKHFSTQGEQSPTVLSCMEHINLGNELLGRYEFDKAMAHFEEAIRLQPDDASLHFKIARIFLQKEDYRNAIMAFRRVLQTNPKHIEAHYELARIFQLQESLEQAHQELGHVLNINPDHEESLKLLVKLFAQEEKYQETLPVLKKLVSISAQPLRYREQIGNFLLKLGKLDDAIAEYQGLLEQAPENALTYQHKLGQAYFEQGNYPKAIECFKIILQEHNLVEGGEMIASVRSQMAAALCNEGVKLYESDDIETAIQRYQEALLYDNANADIHYNLGKAYASIKQTGNALTHFEAGISLNPKDISLHYELAILQDEKGMLEEAHRSYEKVLLMAPQHLNALFGLGTLCGLQGDLNQAIHYLSEAIRLNPSFVDAYYNLGVALERKKDFNKAIQIYKKVMSLDPEHEKARSNLAHIQHMKTQHTS